MDRNIMKKAMMVLVVISVIGLGFIGCGQKSDSPDDSVSTENTDKPVVTKKSPKKGSAKSSFEGSLTSFTTKDLSGNSVDESIFADYDVTMVNVWATWCGACVGAMPELEDLYHEVPKNVNVIGICMDAEDDMEDAQTIIEDSGISFTVLAGSEDMEDSLFYYITGIPTTVFLDSKGNSIGAPVIGAPTEDAAEYYMECIEYALKDVN